MIDKKLKLEEMLHTTSGRKLLDEAIQKYEKEKVKTQKDIKRIRENLETIRSLLPSEIDFEEIYIKEDILFARVNGKAIFLGSIQDLNLELLHYRILESTKVFSQLSKLEQTIPKDAFLYGRIVAGKAVGFQSKETLENLEVYFRFKTKHKPNSFAAKTYLEEKLASSTLEDFLEDLVNLEF